jgi:hypothetical protein
VDPNIAGQTAKTDIPRGQEYNLINGRALEHCFHTGWVAGSEPNKHVGRVVGRRTLAIF